MYGSKFELRDIKILMHAQFKDQCFWHTINLTVLIANIFIVTAKWDHFMVV